MTDRHERAVGGREGDVAARGDRASEAGGRKGCSRTWDSLGHERRRGRLNIGVSSLTKEQCVSAKATSDPEQISEASWTRALNNSHSLCLARGLGGLHGQTSARGALEYWRRPSWTRAQNNSHNLCLARGLGGLLNTTSASYPRTNFRARRAGTLAKTIVDQGAE